MKHKTFICALLVACLSIAAFSTIAYFTTEDTATNVITAGNVKIELKETAIPEGGGEPVPFENQTGVMPGSEVSKIVQVKNTGKQPAYIRIILHKSITLAEDITDESVNLDLIRYDLNTSDWIEKDGYYYYAKPLAAGAETEPLFTRVLFANDMGNLYQDCKIEIQVDVEATQVANNGSTVFEATGWPVDR